MDLNLDIPAASGAGAGHGASDEYDVVIIGGGPAGATAALYAARAELRVAVIDKGATSGALGMTARIANYPGIPGEVSGLDLVQRIRGQAESFGAKFISDKVQAVDLTSEPKTIWGNAGTYTAPAVIVATGSMGRGQRVPGEDRLLGRGVSYCATCDAAFFRGQDVAVAGNCDEAIEEALFLTKFAARVHVLVPAPDFKATPQLVAEATAHPRLDIHYGSALREVLGDDHVEGVRIAPRGQAPQVLPVTGAFIYLQGGRPVTDFLQGQLPSGDTGCLTVDSEYQTEIPGVYAIGDVLCRHVKQAVVAAAEGAVAAMAIEKRVHHRRQLAVDWS